MSIEMIGIDHNRAEIDVRGLFSFTKKTARAAMDQLKQKKGILGVVVLSTCNRMEVWISVDHLWQGDLYESLCQVKRVDKDLFRDAFVCRTEQEAVEHLFHLSCGMRSQILGEDQILTQVKDALALAREYNYTDSTLEVLFRMAITAGKQVKTQVVFPHGSVSAVSGAVERLKADGYKIENSRCMVIGNGQMGLLAAKAFCHAGAAVVITVRKYRHGQVEIPEGCGYVSYEERQRKIPQCDFIISATSSPHYTLTKEMVQQAGYKYGVVFLDLAVPRDIDENIRDLDQVTLFDIDHFKSDISNEEVTSAWEQADQILHTHIEEFYAWMDNHGLAPRIRLIKDAVAEDQLMRIQKPLKKAGLPENQEEQIRNQVENTAKKVMNKLLFGLKEQLTPEEYEHCIAGLERLYGEE